MGNNGEACIVTGAAGSIGQALVRAFGNAGYWVVATDRDNPLMDTPNASFVQADLARTVEDSVYATEIFSEIRNGLRSRPLKAIVNNAAVQILGAIGELGRAEWNETLNVNLLAPFFWAQEFLPELELTRGSILNISSIHARQTKAGFCAYATSKAALSALTRSMAIDLGGSIRINAIEPAAIRTPMLAASFDGDPLGLSVLEKFHPARRLGSPDDLGELARMVVEADAFLNGATIAYDGGISSCLSDPTAGR